MARYKPLQLVPDPFAWHAYAMHLGSMWPNGPTSVHAVGIARPYYAYGWTHIIAIQQNDWKDAWTLAQILKNLPKAILHACPFCGDPFYRPYVIKFAYSPFDRTPPIVQQQHPYDSTPPPVELVGILEYHRMPDQPNLPHMLDWTIPETYTRGIYPRSLLE